jgi:4-hydroxybenzoate polyprenyltransferase
MILQLLRVNQWYKNLVIFLAVFFSGNFFNLDMLYSTVLGFFALCLISSSNYIINDIADIEKDRKHPEKKSRMIASKRISVKGALVIAIFLLLVSFIIAFYLSIGFMFVLLFLLIFTTLYTFLLKKIAFFDLIIISINFVLRAIAGALIINVWISPFLILCPFFLSFFLVSGKRYSDMVLLKKKELYSKKTLKTLIYISFSLLIMSFTIYCLLVHPYLLITLPIVFYLIYSYLKLVLSGSRMARQPELFFIKPFLLFLFIMFLVLLLVIMYRTLL